MTSTSNIIEAMNNVTLDDEEEEGLAFEIPTGTQYGDDSRFSINETDNDCTLEA